MAHHVMLCGWKIVGMMIALIVLAQATRTHGAVVNRMPLITISEHAEHIFNHAVYSSSVSPGGEIDFGDVPLNTTASYTLTITNDAPDLGTRPRGWSVLRLLMISFSGQTPGYFSVEDFQRGTSLSPGESIDLTILLTPTEVGPVGATMTVWALLGRGRPQNFSYTLIDDVVAPTVRIAPTPAAAAGGLFLLSLASLRRR